MQKHLARMLAAAIGMGTAFGLSGCHDGSQPIAAATTLPTAQVATAKRGDITQELTVAGQFQPYQVVDVHPKVSGYMVKINVDIGDIVHQGEILAVLDVPELTAQVRQAAFRVKQSQEEIARAQNEIQRAKAANYALHLDSVRLQQAAATRPGLIAQQELDDAQSRDLSSQAQVDAAKAALAAAQEHAEAARADSERVQALQNYTRVTSPLDGVVIWRYSDTGALIQGGTNTNTTALPIVRVSQSGLLRLRFPVPEDDVKYIRKGDPVDVRVDAINRSFTGKIVRFTRDVNFETRTMETEVDVPNRDLSIAPGMYTNAHLTLATLKNVVTIPVESLILKGQQNTVYVVDSNGRVHIRNVQVGLRGQKLAGISSGLNVGDQVVVGGQAKYQDGEVVSPQVISSPASETSEVTGGMIDMKAEQAVTNASLAPD
jgi:RND family efflux transporter MFP subunit